ncbi:MAG: hypothetical protein CMB97_08095 [Flavobacteriaceae bacterium]|nr:hypothetical protein [Flavobacteriaceae bacterium]
MKASNQDKEFYWIMRDQIREWYSNNGTLLDKVGLHEVLKHYADLDGVSMKTITHDQLQQLKEWTKQYALEHCNIEYDKDERIKLNFER